MRHETHPRLHFMDGWQMQVRRQMLDLHRYDGTHAEQAGTLADDSEDKRRSASWSGSPPAGRDYARNIAAIACTLTASKGKSVRFAKTARRSSDIRFPKEIR